jgi:hypothetical protein
MGLYRVAGTELGASGDDASPTGDASFRDDGSSSHRSSGRFRVAKPDGRKPRDGTGNTVLCDWGLVTVAAVIIEMSVAPSAAADYSLFYGGRGGCTNAYGSYQSCTH